MASAPRAGRPGGASAYPVMAGGATAMTASARPGRARPAAAGRASAPGWRRWRAPLATVAVVLLGGVVIALLKPGRMITG